jgi:hypothetical protein
VPAAPRVFLYLKDSSEKRKATTYSKGDLWVLSTSPYLQPPGRAVQVHPIKHTLKAPGNERFETKL